MLFYAHNCFIRDEFLTLKTENKVLRELEWEGLTPPRFFYKPDYRHKIFSLYVNSHKNLPI